MRRHRRNLVRRPSEDRKPYLVRLGSIQSSMSAVDCGATGLTVGASRTTGANRPLIGAPQPAGLRPDLGPLAAFSASPSTGVQTSAIAAEAEALAITQVFRSSPVTPARNRAASAHAISLRTGSATVSKCVASDATAQSVRVVVLASGRIVPSVKTQDAIQG